MVLQNNLSRFQEEPVISIFFEELSLRKPGNVAEVISREKLKLEKY